MYHQIFPFAVNDPINFVKHIDEITDYGYIENGQDILDLSLGSCGCFPLGFKRTDLIEKVTAQLKIHPFCQADFVTTNDIVNELSTKLYHLSNGYNSIYSLSGSDSIEGAIKLVQMYHKGTNKNKIIGFNKSYHGSTYMSTSVSGSTYMTDYYGKHPNCVSIDYEEIDNTIDDTTSAVFIETVSWGNELKVTDSNYFKHVQNLCNKYGALLVVDDIAFCGGKTGTLFGFEKHGIKPDIFCLGKGITGGYFPLAITMCSKTVADKVKPQFLFHGFSYSFPMPGILSVLEYLKILENEKILDRHGEIINKADMLMNRLLQSNLISDYKSFGVCYNITPSMSMQDTEHRDKFFYKNGLHMGLWNSDSSRILIMMPIIADDNYFDILEFKLTQALSFQKV
jgi:adenosylmethionine-8-amino-7-oxononanoate aminotransferase